MILDIKSAVFMDNNGKDTKHTRPITIKVNFVRNGEKYRMHSIDWCEGGLQMADIATNNFGGNDLNPRIKYTMVRIDNLYKTLLQ